MERGNRLELAGTVLGLAALIVFVWALINLFNVPVSIVALLILAEIRVSYWRVKYKNLIDGLKSSIRYSEGARLSIAPKPNERYAVVYYDSMPIREVEFDTSKN
jgi:hypothetical protein